MDERSRRRVLTVPDPIFFLLLWTVLPTLALVGLARRLPVLETSAQHFFRQRLRRQMAESRRNEDLT